MKQLLHQLDARMARAAARLDLGYRTNTSWSPTATTMPIGVVSAKPDFVAIRTATDVHARRPQEPSP